MADFFNTLNGSWADFINAQKVFFTATAPVDGRINLSPKGMDTFRCLDESTVGYLDLTGSGIETASHLNENGRMTIMFCSFDERPAILRLYGRGSVIRPGEPDWEIYSGRFPDLRGRRSIILMKIESAQKSCGYAVPLMDFREERKLSQNGQRTGNRMDLSGIGRKITPSASMARRAGSISLRANGRFFCANSSSSLTALAGPFSFFKMPATSLALCLMAVFFSV